MENSVKTLLREAYEKDFKFFGEEAGEYSSCRRDMHHKIWAFKEKLIHILRFSLDRNFAAIDTATPDSGDRGSARRTQSRMA
jgi:hypothetical protein